MTWHQIPLYNTLIHVNGYVCSVYIVCILYCLVDCYGIFEHVSMSPIG